MLRLRHKLLIHAFRLSDQAMLYGVLLVLTVVIHMGGDSGELIEFLERSYSFRELAAILLLAGSWAAIFGHYVAYEANRITSLRNQIKCLIKATTYSTFVLFLVAESFSVSSFKGGLVGLFWAITSLLGVGSRVLLRLFLMSIRRSGMNHRFLVLVGTNSRAIELADRIEQRMELGYNIVGFIAEDAAAAKSKALVNGRWPIVGELSDMKGFLRKGSIDEVMVCLPTREYFRQVCEVVELCRELGVVVRFVPDLFDVKVLAKAQLEVFEKDYIVTFFRESMLGQLLLKRIMDILISASLLALLSPLLLLVALLIKLTSPGPVFFVQERMGMNKRKFKLLKFRSMVIDAEKRRSELVALNEMDGPVFKIKNDPRITPIGRFLRRTSIDELPQLINVLRGQMSLVGPRPPIPSEVDQYEWFDRRRLSIKPGITCLWQVEGRNSVPFDKWMELDRQYIDNWSIWLDLKILAKTVPVVLLGKGAS